MSKEATPPVPPPMPDQHTGPEDPASRFGLDADEIGADRRAVEVAAMLGDSVVGVKHLANPRSGRVKPVTYALVALGVAALLISVLAFSRGVSTAKLNKEASRYHTETLQLPYNEFRPQRVGVAYDWMAFGGLGASLFCFAVALVRVRRERVSPYYRLGKTDDVDCASDQFGAGSFPLVAPRGDDFVVNYAGHMSGELVAGGENIALADLVGRGLAHPSSEVAGAFETTLGAQARLRVATGQQSFLISSVPAPKRQAVPALASFSSTLLAFVGGSAIIHLSFWAMLRTIPPEPSTIALTLGGDDRLVTSITNRAEEDAIEEDELPSDEPADDEPGGTGTQMTLESGKMGTEKSTRTAGQYALENRGVDPRLARLNARNAGIAGALQSADMASLTGMADFSSGLDDRTVYGGLMGDEVGEMHGGFGFGAHGDGPGGGWGPGWGTIGTGPYGTIGHGDGTGPGYWTGPGAGRPKPKSNFKGPEVKINRAESSGGLDPTIIRRYVKRKLPRIKHCYEKQLLVRPDLRGTIVTSFQITPTGAVLNPQAKGVSKEVSGCVASVIGGIQFPKPTDGGLVIVRRYPFNFRPAGG